MDTKKILNEEINSPKKTIKKDKKPIECFCGKKYKNRNTYKNHKKLKHADKSVSDEEKNSKTLKIDLISLNSFKNDFKNFIKILSPIKNEELLINKEFLCFKKIFKEKKYYEKIEIEYFKIVKNYKEKKNIKKACYIFKEDYFIEIVNENLDFNCYQIFALFLFYISDFIDQKIFYNILYIFSTFSICLNEKGSNKNKGMKIDMNFCDVKNAENIPNYLNIYLLDYFQNCVLNMNLLKKDFELEIFGVEPLRMMKVILFLKFFCQWLFINSFTSQEIDLTNKF